MSLSIVLMRKHKFSMLSEMSQIEHELQNTGDKEKFPEENSFVVYPQSDFHSVI